MVDAMVNGEGSVQAQLAEMRAMFASVAEVVSSLAKSRESRGSRTPADTGPLQVAVGLHEDARGAKWFAFGVRGGGGRPLNFGMGARKVATILSLVDRIEEIAKAHGIALPVGEDVSLRLAPEALAPRAEAKRVA